MLLFLFECSCWGGAVQEKPKAPSFQIGLGEICRVVAQVIRIDWQSHISHTTTYFQACACGHATAFASCLLAFMACLCVNTYAAVSACR